MRILCVRPGIVQHGAGSQMHQSSVITVSTALYCIAIVGLHIVPLYLPRYTLARTARRAAILSEKTSQTDVGLWMQPGRRCVRISWSFGVEYQLAIDVPFESITLSVLINPVPTRRSTTPGPPRRVPSSRRPHSRPLRPHPGQSQVQTRCVFQFSQHMHIYAL